jgi:hypothetical protein
MGKQNGPPKRALFSFRFFLFSFRFRHVWVIKMVDWNIQLPFQTVNVSPPNFPFQDRFFHEIALSDHERMGMSIGNGNADSIGSQSANHAVCRCALAHLGRNLIRFRLNVRDAIEVKGLQQTGVLTHLRIVVDALLIQLPEVLPR